MGEQATIRYLQEGAEQQAAFELMRELRPHLVDADAFAQQVRRQAQQGYRLLGAFYGKQLLGLAGVRISENLLYGRFTYVDDLVVAPAMRGLRVGAALLDAARAEGLRSGHAYLVLDTGLHMPLAQRFYYREGLLAKGMHFVQALPAAEGQRHG
ncbi:GNAT family N-acetyltransferase [Pseudomonas donghuensis]|uniref:GNAT family N-acetyltransferase n=1 Tax=Pseudomonas donghuensis TaxID=1163398 RepID=UPI002E15B65C|nr:GNAT family N-acetyltransferase [Pseudomonas donghuensis]